MSSPSSNYLRGSVLSPMMAMAKLKQRALWGIAIQHNLREKLPRWDHVIDGSRSHLNTVLHGPASGLVLRASVASRIAALGYKPRKDAVWGIEVLFSLHPAHRVDETEYFSACVGWVSTWCGGRENILSAVVHRDETAPHCHVLLLPVVEGRLRGSDMFGHPARLAKLQQSFRSSVATLFGLSDWRSSAEILTQISGTRALPKPGRRMSRSAVKPMLCRVCAAHPTSDSTSFSSSEVNEQWRRASRRVEVALSEGMVCKDIDILVGDVREVLDVAERILREKQRNSQQLEPGSTAQ